MDQTRFFGLGSTAFAALLTLCLVGGLTAQTTYTSTPATSLASSPTASVATDLDGDGDQDLAVCITSSNQIQFLMNDGTGAMTPGILTTVGLGPIDIVAVDLDGDGDEDLATCCNGSSEVSVMTNLGSGLFSSPVNVAAGSDAFRIVPADVDDDGDMDLIVCNFSANAITLITNLPTGLFVVGTLPGFPGCSDGAFADFDVDGDKDLVFVLSSANALFILENTAAGFVAGPMIPVGSVPLSLVVADLTNNGRLDIATCNVGSSNVSVLSNQLGLNFTRADYATDVTPTTLELTNSDNASGLDLALTSFNGFNVRVLRNNGLGAFSDQIVSFVGANPISVVSADFDGDFHDDLATVSFSGNESQVFLNDLADPIYPGTNEDLELGTGVNGPPISGTSQNIFLASQGEIVETKMESPLGAFDGLQALLIFQLFYPGFPPPSPLVGVHVNQFGFGAVIALNQPLSPTGDSYFFMVPPGISGFSLMAQAISLTNTAANNTYAASNAHELRFQ